MFERDLLEGLGLYPIVLEEGIHATRVTVHVSSGGSYFPGTTERIMVLSGRPANVRAALQEVVGKFEICNQIAQTQTTSFGTAKVPSRPGSSPTVLRLVVPNSSVGTLMGKQGKEIKRLALICSVNIKISPRLDGVLERIVNITGAASQCTLAGCLITESIRGNLHVSEHANTLAYTAHQHAQASKQAETFQELISAPSGAVASAHALLKELSGPPKGVSGSALDSARHKNGVSKGDVKLPLQIALEEKMRRCLRSAIQDGLTKEATRKVAQLEREILGLGPTPELSLIAQALNAGMTDPNTTAVGHATAPPGGKTVASSTAELYRQLLDERATVAAMMGTADEGVPPPVEMMMTVDTAIVGPAVTSANVGGPASKLNFDYLRHSSRGEGEAGESTCSESSLKLLSAAAGFSVDPVQGKHESGKNNK
ncbi:conserved hypothetical protein [Perkinsus marinus ATCC 50983]|uniref:K Homology domain-containing protein n=1 Tax=Perkinsus marinus (strain ATCC 50983 / TXsc) TaxID=423536 RepID=C5KAX9_PERM5|nr:conserved hypothetical protein [Perkinsus marinus ATCC 50983]EER18305.1 conserved hypothetical protein [Perkinsus marinus ATCC 50983]|eukprot:XP_002786509.1 conserved hypothetical protein [Perkinsus marinus ATCC 50983]